MFNLSLTTHQSNANVHLKTINRIRTLPVPISIPLTPPAGVMRQATARSRRWLWIRSFVRSSVPPEADLSWPARHSRNNHIVALSDSNACCRTKLRLIEAPSFSTPGSNLDTAPELRVLHARLIPGPILGWYTVNTQGPSRGLPRPDPLPRERAPVAPAHQTSSRVSSR